MPRVGPEIGLAGQAVRDGRVAGAARLGGAAAGLHGGAAHAHRRLPHHLQAAARPLPALSARARARRLRRGEFTDTFTVATQYGNVRQKMSLYRDYSDHKNVNRSERF